MGIIKTAILSGVGIYGINKLAKAQENHHSNPSPNNCPPQGAGYWVPSDQSPRDARQDSYQARGYSADYEEERNISKDGEFVYQARQHNTPPSYGAQQQQYSQQQGYQQHALPYEPRGSNTDAAGLLGTAMEFMGNQRGRK